MKSQQTPKKTQASISSFFTKKSDTPSQAADPPPPASSPAEETLYDAETDRESSANPNATTTTGTKRVLAEDVNGGNTRIVERPSKRSKVVEEEGGEDDQSSSPVAATAQKSSGKSKGAPRTERYMFSSQPSSAGPAIEEGEESETEKTRKVELHKKFVKKLGHPDSIKKSNRQTPDDAPVAEEGDEEEEEEEAPAPVTSRKKGAKTGKLTPLELQVLDIKRKHMDTVLIVEVGYKFRFFGEDARTAAKVLSIVCIPGKYRFDEHPSEAHFNRFASASIPVHRLHVHAKRLIAAGHKIGIVRQLETAALKQAGDNRNAPFTRKLTNVYTKGTYIDDIEGLADQPTDAPSSGAPATGYLLCITESNCKGLGTDEKVEVGILAVQPATGDIIYDNFEDGFMRSEIETRLLHIAPCEFLIVGELTKVTDKLVQYLSGSSTNVFGDRIRVERVEKSKTMATESHSHVAEFYADKLRRGMFGDKLTMLAHFSAESKEDVNSKSNEREQQLLEKVMELTEPVTICLSAMITHLTEYGLEHVFDLTKYFQSFSARSHMLLNGNTLTSLEIYTNQTDHTEKGSLFWTLDKTQTKFGQRLLRKWVGRPLLDKQRLEARVSAVQELVENAQTTHVETLRSVLLNIRSDLERSLLRIYYGKCTRPELLTVLQTLQKVATEFTHLNSASPSKFTSPLIATALSSFPQISPPIIDILSQISTSSARQDDKYSFFLEEHETEAISDHKLGIAAVEAELSAHLTSICTTLHKKSPPPYVTVAGIEYLIEVPNSELKHVPASWAKISGTKKLSRFHTPDIIRLLRERDQHKESLSHSCDLAFKALLSQISTQYVLFRDCITQLGTLDCLLSLATVATLPGYVKPTFSDETEICVVGGRHPMVEQLLSSAYIPNDTSLSTSVDHTRTLLVTGPNMGGKSSYVRHLALICLLAQIGSYVPATSARLGLLDAIYTRMGAYDCLFQAQSTFAVELSETATILKSATERSLVILDELGRGTSTHDGVAIAEAVLDWVVREKRCLCLFITHYQTMAGMARAFEKGGELKNVHMKFKAEKGNGRIASADGKDDGDEEITFLYEVGEGVAHRSYGLNVARLARVPKSVLDTAAFKSRELEMEVKQKRILGLSQMMSNVLENDDADHLDQLFVGIDQL